MVAALFSSSSPTSISDLTSFFCSSSIYHSSFPSTASPLALSPSATLSLSPSFSPSRALLTPVALSSSPIPISSLFIHLPSLPSLPSSSNTHPMITRSKSSLPTLVSTACSSVVTKPSSYKVVLLSKDWFHAMIEEFSSLQGQHTWTLVPPSPSQYVIGCKWVFRIKKYADGSIVRFKARLAVKGYLQEEGADFHDTFSPVAKQPTVRILLCLALHFQWPIRQLNVSNVFLHGHLSKEVHMTQPPGFEDSVHPSYVCKLNKALYGLKQAPHAWYTTFFSHLLSLGFHNSACNTSLFIQHTSTSLTFLLVYVDDILLTGNNSSHLTYFIHQLNFVFPLKDLGHLSYFLGVPVALTSSGLFLSQQKYATDILTKAGMLDCKTYSSPMSMKTSTTVNSSLPFSNHSLYRSLVGAL